MIKIPTAEEFLIGDEDNEPWTGSTKEAMIEFAKIHVKSALKAANNDVSECYICKNSLLDSYPESNIK